MECGLEERKLSRKMDAESIDQLKEQGMTVTYPDKQEFIMTVFTLRCASSDSAAPHFQLVVEQDVAMGELVVVCCHAICTNPS